MLVHAFWGENPKLCPCIKKKLNNTISVFNISNKAVGFPQAYLILCFFSLFSTVKHKAYSGLVEVTCENDGRHPHMVTDTRIKKYKYKKYIQIKRFKKAKNAFFFFLQSLIKPSCA